MKRSAMKRGTGQLKRSGFPAKPRKPLNRVGPRTRAWSEERAKLKRRFEAVGIVTCELFYAGCAFDDYLGFAHAKKRRKLTREDLGVVILACNFCHDQIEGLAPESMESIVMSTIADRKRQP